MSTLPLKLGQTLPEVQNSGIKSVQARNPPWLLNPGQTLPEVQNRGIIGPTKRNRVLQKFEKKTKQKTVVSMAPQKNFCPSKNERNSPLEGVVFLLKISETLLSHVIFKSQPVTN